MKRVRFKDESVEEGVSAGAGAGTEPKADVDQDCMDWIGQAKRMRLEAQPAVAIDEAIDALVRRTTALARKHKHVGAILSIDITQLSTLGIVQLTHKHIDALQQLVPDGSEPRAAVPLLAVQRACKLWGVKLSLLQRKFSKCVWFDDASEAKDRVVPRSRLLSHASCMRPFNKGWTLVSGNAASFRTEHFFTAPLWQSILICARELVGGQHESSVSLEGRHTSCVHVCDRSRLQWSHPPCHPTIDFLMWWDRMYRVAQLDSRIPCLPKCEYREASMAAAPTRTSVVFQDGLVWRLWGRQVGLLDLVTTVVICVESMSLFKWKLRTISARRRYAHAMKRLHGYGLDHSIQLLRMLLNMDTDSRWTRHKVRCALPSLLPMHVWGVKHVFAPDESFDP